MRSFLLTLSGIALTLSVVVTPARADSLLDFDAAVEALAQFAPELSPPPNSPNKDIVVGGFQAGAFPGWNNGVSVYSGPAGQNLRGHASATQPDLGRKIREDAVCLAVQGNLAAVGFRGVFSGSGFVEDPYEEIAVFRDGGPGGKMDRFHAFRPDTVIPGAGVMQCAAYLLLAESAPLLLRGNILVNDAP